MSARETRDRFVFSRRDYCLSLPHVGHPLSVPGLGTTLLARPIPGSGRSDLVGPWPYTAAPEPALLERALAALRQDGFVSLTMFLRPDTAAGHVAALGGVADVVPLKDHYIRDPRQPPPAIRARTRRNLAIAERHWRIRALARAEIPPLCGPWQDQLAARRRLSDYARVGPEHFAAIARLDAVEAMAAEDDDGPGAVLVAARAGDETHLLHFLTTPRVIPTCGSYLLWDRALRAWSRDGRVYLGGAPGAEDGPGIARFKARWANRTAPAFLLKAVLDGGAYRALAGRSPARSFFPAYRDAPA